MAAEPGNYRALLSELIYCVKNLTRYADLNHLYAHFTDSDGDDIGDLSVASALEALDNEIYLWPDCGPCLDSETGEQGELDLRDAVGVRIETH